MSSHSVKRWQANCQCAFLCRPTRLAKTHRFLSHLSLRWWPSWSCQAQACRCCRQARGGWRRRGRGVKASATIRVVTFGLYHVPYYCTNIKKSCSQGIHHLVGPATPGLREGCSSCLSPRKTECFIAKLWAYDENYVTPDKSILAVWNCVCNFARINELLPI